MTEVASGWTVDESGRLRRETVHSMKRRCRDWDYRSRCIYMITVELADRRSKALGRLLVAELETPEYRERKDELFAAAKHGAVLLSPCVSDGERQIAHEALSAKLKLITMANKGF